MANYNISATTGSASTPQLITTDKVRIASTTNIYITSGSSNVAAANTDPIVLAGAVERSFYVGANNYISVRAVSSNGVCSVTELGTDGVL
jgi:hypothetical protein